MLAHQTQHILDLCSIILILLIYNQRFINFFILKLHCSVLLCILIVTINKKTSCFFILLNYKKIIKNNTLYC